MPPHGNNEVLVVLGLVVLELVVVELLVLELVLDVVTVTHVHRSWGCTPMQMRPPGHEPAHTGKMPPHGIGVVVLVVVAMVVVDAVASGPDVDVVLLLAGTVVVDWSGHGGEPATPS
jgi:hypothetical protein